MWPITFCPAWVRWARSPLSSGGVDLRQRAAEPAGPAGDDRGPFAAHAPTLRRHASNASALVISGV